MWRWEKEEEGVILVQVRVNFIRCHWPRIKKKEKWREEARERKEKKKSRLVGVYIPAADDGPSSLALSLI
jgi:hypothetical protein